MSNFARNGFGQVEPQQLSAQKTGQIFASLPLHADVNVLQNGEFMYYDYANGSVNCGLAKDTSKGIVATAGEPMLVFNEVKLYDGWRETYKDFAMQRVGNGQLYVTSKQAAERFADGTQTADGEGIDLGYRLDGIVPRLFKTNVGDIYTTNMVKTGVQYAVGDQLTPKKNTTSNTLALEKAADSDTGMMWSVVKVYTLADGQDALKLQRVQ